VIPRPAAAPTADVRGVAIPRVSPPAALLRAPVQRPLLPPGPHLLLSTARHCRSEEAPAPDAPIRVLVVDDHAVVRAELADLLGATDGMEVVGEAADGHEAVEFAADLRPDVVLMDVSMPNMSGLEAARVLTQQHPGVRVLMHSADVRCSVVSAARDAGAVGFLVKGSRSNDIVGAIRAARAGRPVWPDCA